MTWTKARRGRARHICWSLVLAGGEPVAVARLVPTAARLLGDSGLSDQGSGARSVAGDSVIGGGCGSSPALGSVGGPCVIDQS